MKLEPRQSEDNLGVGGTAQQQGAMDQAAGSVWGREVQSATGSRVGGSLLKMLRGGMWGGEPCFGLREQSASLSQGQDPSCQDGCSLDQVAGLDKFAAVAGGPSHRYRPAAG